MMEERALFSHLTSVLSQFSHLEFRLFPLRQCVVLLIARIRFFLSIFSWQAMNEPKILQFIKKDLLSNYGKM